MVNISTTGHFKKSKTSPEEPFGPWFRRFLDRYQQSAFGLPEDQLGRGIGSGFIVNKEGYVVTNLNGVNNAQNITVTRNAGTQQLLETFNALLRIARIEARTTHHSYSPCSLSDIARAPRNFTNHSQRQGRRSYPIT